MAGFISRDEMTRYLFSVFKVLYSADAATEGKMGVGAEELARITADQCFAEADLNHDGRLSFDEFKRWYMQPQGGAPAGAAAGGGSGVMDLATARELTGLGNFLPEDVFELFAERADGDGFLSRSAFNAAVRQIPSPAGGNADAAAAVWGVLFEVFNAEDEAEDLVDFSELASGLSILCGGQSDNRVRSAFALFDFNGDGFISVEEMTRYMARRSSAEHLIATNALRRTATAWIFTVAESLAKF